MIKQPIGAYATVQWIDSEPSQYSDVYFSFGQFDEEKDKDTFGVNDMNIFYYAHDPHDMEKMKNNTRDFKVISYQLEYQQGEKA